MRRWLLLVVVLRRCRLAAAGGRPPPANGSSSSASTAWTTTSRGSLIDKGRLPNFARLAASGGFAPLGTSIPPQSPVAWSTFITGLDPGGHGIFDFIHRDPKTMVPYLSTSRTEGSSRDDHGRRVADSALWRQRRTPATGPAVLGSAGGARHRDDDHPHAGELSALRHCHTRVEWHGHAGPSRDLRHVFVLHIRAVCVRRPDVVRAGRCIPSRSKATSCAPRLHGPDNPFRKVPEKVSADFTLYIDAERPVAKLVVGDEERVLAVGEWSDWVPVDFDLRVPLQSVRGMCRFYLKR